MAPRIFTLLRSPVTGISGGHPTRLQVAWSVESCRKLASSVKRSAQCRERAFFLGRDRCGGAIGPAPQRRRGPARGGAVALKIPSREAICAHGRDDTEHRTPPRSPRQSWATSRCRYPDRKQPDRCREYLLTVAVASLSSPMAGPTDTLPADHRHRRSDTAAATPIPWIAAPAGSPLMRRWYVLRNSAPPPAIVSPHGRPPLFPLLCSGEPTADRCWDAIATGVAPYGLRGPLCHICPFIYARMYIYEPNRGEFFLHGLVVPHPQVQATSKKRFCRGRKTARDFFLAQRTAGKEAVHSFRTAIVIVLKDVIFQVR